ncbi:FAD-dependent oxidoreductase [Janibacter hoylei]|nr:FAD-dependent oxidoreductase [Janibacter hoylei]
MTPADVDTTVDTDVLVIGSGFGGSVAALRLAEKGYRVTVLEAGRRFADEDFAETSWDLKNFLWAPKVGMYGIQRIHMLKDVMILAGAGVGGGSLNYANTLYVPPEVFFRDRQWGHITDWQAELLPHYDMASTMLGVVTNRCESVVEQAMREAADEMGVADTFRKTPVGVLFGEDDSPEQQGRTVADPYFGGAGPTRTTCTECGNCMVGCRVGAKNTLVKNYLALGEGLGVQIVPMRTVTRVGVVPGTEGPDEVYRVRHEATDALGDKTARVTTARKVVVAAGTWGTQRLLHEMKADGELPAISDRLGELTRTNSEALVGALASSPPEGEHDLTKGWPSPPPSTRTSRPTSKTSATGAGRTRWACSPRCSRRRGQGAPRASSSSSRTCRRTSRRSSRGSPRARTSPTARSSAWSCSRSTTR